MVHVVAEAGDEEADSLQHREVMPRLQQAEHGVGDFERVVPVVIRNVSVVFADLNWDADCATESR